MKTSIIFRIFVITFIIGSFSYPRYGVRGYSIPERDQSIKPPEGIRDGEWSDDFWTGQLQEAENIDVLASHLLLKFKEQLHWTQTWTAHFAGGEFWQTEAISDSVRLAWNDIQENYFTTGIYTSTVYNAGKSVDWSTTVWRFSGIPDDLDLEFRTGNTPVPDGTWTSWHIPVKKMMEDYCAYTFNTHETECYSGMIGIDSSQYIQYRGLFNSDDPANTALHDIDFLYGIHYLHGSAISIPVPPVDLRAWESVILTSTVPASTTLVIDILAPDGTVLISDVGQGTSLEGIDPQVHPAVQLRARLAAYDESISPDVDIWGVRWYVWNRLYCPIILR